MDAKHIHNHKEYFKVDFLKKIKVSQSEKLACFHLFDEK